MSIPVLFPPPREVLDFDGIEVQILDVETFREWEPETRSHVVSIGDPGDECPPISLGGFTRSAFRVEFHDIPEPMRGLHGIDKEAAGIARWLLELRDGGQRFGNARFVVHCTHGVSRSAAIAAVWLRMHDRDPARLYELFAPNPWVVAAVEKEIAKAWR